VICLLIQRETVSQPLKPAHFHEILLFDYLSETIFSCAVASDCPARDIEQSKWSAECGQTDNSQPVVGKFIGMSR